MDVRNEKNKVGKTIGAIVAVPLVAISIAMGFSMANTSRYTKAQEQISKKNNYKNFEIIAISPRVYNNIFLLDVYGSYSNYYNEQGKVNLTYAITERQYEILKNVYDAKYNVDENKNILGIEQTKTPIVMEEEILLIVKSRVPKINDGVTKLNSISKLFCNEKNSYFYIDLLANDLPIKLKIETTSYDSAKQTYESFFEGNFNLKEVDLQNEFSL